MERPAARRRRRAAGAVAPLLAAGLSLLALGGSARSTSEVPGIDDPRLDGWSSEVSYGAANARLGRVAALLEGPEEIGESAVADLVAAEFATAGLRPRRLEETVARPLWTLLRAPADGPRDGEGRIRYRGAAGLAEALRELVRATEGAASRHAKFKIVGVSEEGTSFSTRQLFSLSGIGGSEGVEIHAVWESNWSRPAPDAAPRLLSVAVSGYRENRYRGSRYRGGGPTLFSDCTESALAGDPSFSAQLMRGPDYWLPRLEAGLGTDVMGHSGLAVGDVDGDGLEDLYLLQPGGLPNLLFLHRPDGTVEESGAAAGVDWLDRSHAALFVDLDNDGDQDLIVATTAATLFLSNDGRGRFTLRSSHRPSRFAYSLAAADYDADGDVDLFAARYGPVGDDPVDEALDVPNPIPYHDALNGAPNALLRNDGSWRFADATEEAGLDDGNRRWSFAAAWEDYDRDGDVDLYVANDFGPNGLYRNDGGRFVEVAGRAGVEDVASGMSVSWGDYDGDGWRDLYVGNMFSSAGNRITRQRRFMPGAPDSARRLMTRLASGNSLFRNRGDGTFAEVEGAAGAAMGRWAWSAPFVDLDNDGWEDLVVANGFLTAEKPDDL